MAIEKGTLLEVNVHSLRSGFATTAAKRGKSLDAIMRHGRWKDQRVAMGYIRPADPFNKTSNAAAGLDAEEEDE